MERGSSSRRRSSRRATGEEAAVAAGTWGDAAPASGDRPNYPCNICRHGFTTAQALGGHMNMHRRDRAARRPAGRDAPATGTASAAYYPPAPLPVGSSYATYDYSGAAYAAADAMSYGSASQTELNLFGAAAVARGHHADLNLGLGSRVPEEWERPDGEAERSVDLELRLGRHPAVWGWQ